MKRNNAGFTILELMVVIAIIAILSAIAVPNMIGWRERAKLRGAIANLRGDLQWAKTRAIREHAPVSVLFYTNRYEIFVDNGAGGVTAADYIRNGDEPLVRSRQLPASVTIDLDLPNIDQTQFDSRGRCPGVGTLVLQDSTGEQKQISINPLGQIRQE
jgi:type IV fimbrial biogenesis protein FimT